MWAICASLMKSESATSGDDNGPGVCPYGVESLWGGTVDINPLSMVSHCTSRLMSKNPYTESNRSQPDDNPKVDKDSKQEDIDRHARIDATGEDLRTNQGVRIA